MAQQIDKGLDKLTNIKNKVEAFSEILEGLSSTEEKKKLLWREIYENAIVDRENASMLFTDAWKSMQGGTSEHVSLGTTMSKYLERMCKSNDQILKLAELVAKEQESDTISPDDIFNEIGSK